MAVARGDEPADLVLSGGHVLSVFTKEWLDVDVAVKDGHVVGLGRYEGREKLDVAGAYLVPGFVDAHMHIESSKLMVDEFARAVLAHGTTAVVAGAPSELAKLETGLTDHVDGHAPGVRGAALNAYIAAGISSDHESMTFEEALEKRRLGMWVLLREASIARNLRDLLPLVKTYGTDWCAFCTDDREPDFIVEQGHINQMVRAAVEEGVSPEDALVMATINPATYHRLWRLGAIAPGYQADILVLDDLKSFRPRDVLKRGARPRFVKLDVPQWVRQTVSIAPVEAASFRTTGRPKRIRVMRVIPAQL